MCIWKHLQCWLNIHCVVVIMFSLLQKNSHTLLNKFSSKVVKTYQYLQFRQLKSVQSIRAGHKIKSSLAK